MSQRAGEKGKGKILKRADPSTIQDKFMVGYQGWFTCAGDGEPVGPGHHGWLHWFSYPIPDGGRPNTDLWPDVSEYSPSELFPAPGLKFKNGDQAFLFSSRHPKTVQRHFNWMAQHGVDGAFLQRFAGQCDLEGGNEGIMRIRDEVGDRVKEAAEKEGRVFAIMYDVSGVAPDQIQRVLERDWIHLIRDKGVLDSPNYLREKGKAVVALWGFGFNGAGHSPSTIKAITAYIRNVTPGGAYIMAGIPAYWRTSDNDADRNPEFLDVWLNDFDAISPWTVGRYDTEQDADDFAETKIKGDVELLKKRNEEGKWRKVDYIPVVLPGGSGFNLSEGKWGFNNIKRNGGHFLWKQIFNVRRQGVRTIYGAMWDEYDEGTAFMPVIEKKRLLPQSDKYPFMALDEDGFDLPADWYMRICGFAAESLRGERMVHETFPVKELQDYWATRPKYEEVDTKSGDFVSGTALGTGSGGGDGQSYQEWLTTQKDDKEEPPPPPYTLEEAASGPSSSSNPNVSATSSPPAPQPSLSTRPLSQSSASGVPPRVDPGSRPQYSTSNHALAPVRPSASGFESSISSLTDEFNRHGIIPSNSEGTRPVAATSGPPPLHPSHPGAQLPHGPPIPASSRPNQAPNSPPSSPPLRPHISAEAQSVGRSEWPPPEWQVGQAQTQSQHQHQQQHQQLQPLPYIPYVRPPRDDQAMAGANLPRPSSHSPSSPVTPRPHGSLGSASTSLSPATSQPASQYSYPELSQRPGRSPAPPAASSYAPSFNTDGPPSVYAPPSVPPLHPRHHQYPYSSGFPHPSPPRSPQMPTYGDAFPTQFPQAQTDVNTNEGTGEYFPMPLQDPRQQMYPAQPMYPYKNNNDPSLYGQQPGTWYPGGPSPPGPPPPIPLRPSHSGASPESWYPGSGGPPPIPQRPPTHSSYSNFPSPSTSTNSPGGFGRPLGLSLSSMDKIVGRRTREQLENQVGSLAQTGSKLFGKFTK